MRHRKLDLPHPFRQSVKYDRIEATDFLRQNLIFSCEQCSHFAAGETRCTIGYDCTPHLRANNLKAYETSGRMALCRYLEID
jgi:hypothetical protein